jgi:hypothetical protein
MIEVTMTPVATMFFRSVSFLA